jgi:hypothetical protein
MSVFDALVEFLIEATRASVRFLRDLPNLPARRREARRLAQQAEATARAQRDVAERAEAARRAMVGRQATVVRPLKRSGQIEIDGQTHDAMSEHGFVDTGVQVTITRWTGRHFEVRPDPLSPTP